MKKKFYLIKFSVSALILLISFKSSSQSSTPEIYYNRGLEHLTNYKVDSALADFKLAASLYQTTNSMNKFHACQNLIARANIISFKLKEAEKILYSYLDTIKKAHEPEVLSYSYSLLGDVARYQNNNMLALQYYDSSLSTLNTLEIGDWKDVLINIAEVHEKKGWIEINTGEIRVALNDFETAFAWSKQHKTPLETSLYGLGVSHFLLGGYETSIEYYEKALRIFTDKYGETHFRVAVLNNEIGGALRELKKYNEALTRFQTAVKIYHSVLGEKHMNVAAAYNNIGLIYEDLGKYDSAILSMEKALSIHKALGSTNTKNVGTMYANIAHNYYLNSDYSSAMKFYRKSKSVYTKLEIVRDYDRADLDQNMSDCFIKLGNLDSALLYNQYALIANSIKFNNKSLESNPSAADHINSYLQLSIYIQKLTLIELTNNLSAFKPTIAAADSLINYSRQMYSSYQDKINLGERASQFYRLATDVLIHNYKAKIEKEYFDQIYFLSSKNKASMLQDIYKWSDARRFNNIPDSLLKAEEVLKQDLALYNSQLINTTDDTELRNYKDEIFEANRRLETLEKKLQFQFPIYHLINNAYIPENIGHLKETLAPHETILEFIVTTNSIVCLAITKDNQELHVVNNIDRLTEATLTLRESLGSTTLGIGENAQKKFLSSSRTIYTLLLEPILFKLNIKEGILTIVPDGFLWDIPFDLLLTNDVDLTDLNFREYPYLIKNFETRYKYSSGLKRMNRPTSVNRKYAEIMTLAPTYDSTLIKDFSQLKWSEKEANQIVRSYAGKSFAGFTCSESIFKKEVENYGILHFSAHALVNNDFPMYSKLVLTESKDSLEDGMLHAFELYQMTMDAQLVVLGACNSGSGKISNGEGILSLAYGFMYAGVPSIVASHWIVDDASSYLIMEKFYNNLNDGMDKGAALRKAKLEALQELPANKTFPMYWGGYYLIGDTNPIDIEPNRISTFLLLSIVGFVAFILLTIYNVKFSAKRFKGLNERDL